MELSDKAHEQIKSLLDRIISDDNRQNPELSTQMREAYKALTGESYINKRETKFRATEMEIKRDHLLVTPVIANEGEVWTHLPTGRDFTAQDHHNRTLFLPVSNEAIHPGEFKAGDRFNLKGREGEVSEQNASANRTVDPVNTPPQRQVVNEAPTNAEKAEKQGRQQNDNDSVDVDTNEDSRENTRDNSRTGRQSEAARTGERGAKSTVTNKSQQGMKQATQSKTAQKSAPKTGKTADKSAKTALQPLKSKSKGAKPASKGAKSKK